MDNILPSGYTATVKEETNVNEIKIKVDNGPPYLVQCPFCNFYLGQQEYYEYHRADCCKGLDVVEKVLRIQHIKVDGRNVSGETPLYLSLFENRPDDIVSALIDAGCSVNSAHGCVMETPLHLAVLRQSEAIAYKLIEKGADMNAHDSIYGLTPLHVAIIKCSDEKFVSSLINLASDVNISDDTEYTPLYYAAYRESTFIARKLIEKGADLNFTNLNGDTLLHNALRIDNLEYLYMLLYYNAPANETNLDGRTPFFETVRSYRHNNIRNKETIQYLMNYVTDINQEDEDHTTVLHRALMSGSDIALDILENDADVNKLAEGMHSLYSAWTQHSSYDVLKIIWQKTDFKIFLTSEVLKEDRGKSFLNIYCERCRLLTDEFLKYLFMMFESPYIEDIVQPRCPEIQEFLIATIIWERDLTLDQSVELLNVFLSFGVIVHFVDVCALYEVYGFDENLELLLMSGCYINPGVTKRYCASPLIYRICYDDNLHEQFREMCSFTTEKSNNQAVITQDPEFYRGTPQIKNGKLILCCPAGEVRSLVEISRDVIRKRIYRKCTTCYSFNAFSAMSKLPVPITIRDILYLKRQIYANT